MKKIVGLEKRSRKGPRRPQNVDLARTKSEASVSILMIKAIKCKLIK